MIAWQLINSKVATVYAYTGAFKGEYIHGSVEEQYISPASIF